MGGETVTIVAAKDYDDYGNVVTKGKDFCIPDCVVSPQGESDVWENDIFGGNTTTLLVVAPGGYRLKDNQEVIIRGVRYTVKYPSWDYSHGRQPWCSFHKPKTTFIVERSEG